MRTQDIKIGETYRHITSPNYAYAKVLAIFRPKPKRSIFATDFEKEIKSVHVKCEWSTNKNDSYGLIKYFRPCDLIKIKD